MTFQPRERSLSGSLHLALLATLVGASCIARTPGGGGASSSSSGTGGASTSSGGGRGGATASSSSGTGGGGVSSSSGAGGAGTSTSSSSHGAGGSGTGGTTATTSTAATSSSSSGSTTSTATTGSGGAASATATGSGGGTTTSSSGGGTDGGTDGGTCGPSPTAGLTGDACSVDCDCQMCPPGSSPGASFCVPGRCVNGTCGAQALYPGACVTEWVVDATSLYWTCSSSGTVMTAPKDGSGPVTTVASGQTGADGIAVDATQLYWTSPGNGTVMAAPLGTTALTTLAPALSDLSLIHVGGGYAWVMAGGELVQIPVGGGAVVSAWAGDVLMGLTVDASNVYWSTACANDEGQTISGGEYAMPLAGGTVTSLGGDWPYVSLPEWVRLIPWAGGFEGYGLVGGCCGTPLGEISSACAMTAYEEQGVLTTPSPYLLDGATDGTTIYWAGWWCGNVVVMARGLPFGGCLPGSPFGPVVDLPASRIAVDDTYVYLYANGTISRAFK